MGQLVDTVLHCKWHIVSKLFLTVCCKCFHRRHKLVSDDEEEEEDDFEDSDEQDECKNHAIAIALNFIKCITL